MNFDDWQFFQTQNLRTDMTGALERLVQCFSDQDEFEAVIGYARRWLEMDRTNETAHRHLMESYAKTGQRAAALRQYEECVQVLEKELRVAPQEETKELYDRIKGNQVHAVKSSSIYKPPEVSTDNLPAQLTSFIGREGEIAELKDLLTTTRLLTLTGAGGCGKTRLGLKIASDLVEEYADGVWLVELASLSDPALVPQGVAGTLNLSEIQGRSFSDTLSTYLQSKRMLLVLDNCEHLIEACVTISEVLLRACPNLRILATSREALGLTGELTYRVPSLSLPDPKNLPPTNSLIQYEALRLFIERALLSQPAFIMNDRNAPRVVEICRRLDGVPLAIELAAARLKVLSVEDIARRLDDRFKLLTDGGRRALPRHRTLLATMDWSYDLLSRDERKLLNRMSVFVGGCTLSGVETVCEGGVPPDDVLNLLTQLVDKSMVIVEEASSKDGEGKVRYQLLETVRSYALQRLRDDDEEESSRERHATFFLSLAERAEPELKGPDQIEWLKRLDIEYENMRAVLAWSMGGEDREVIKRNDISLRLAGALIWFWWWRGYFSEGQRWLEDALAQSSEASASIKAKALGGAGSLAQNQGDRVRAKELIDRSLALYRELGDKRGVSLSLTMLGYVALTLGDYDRVKVLGQEGLNLAREVGDKWVSSFSLCLLGIVAMDRGDYERATELYQESLDLAREVGDTGNIALSLEFLGVVARYQGNYEQARPLFEESGVLFRELGDKDISSIQKELALIDLDQGNYERAKNTLEKSLETNRELGDKLGMAWRLTFLGLIADHQDDYEGAIKLYKESLTLFLEMGDKRNIPRCLIGLALVARKQGQHERAARLFASAEVMRRNLGTPVTPPYRDDHDKGLAAVHAELGKEAFERAWEEGKAMSTEEAVEFALSQ